MSEFDLIQKNIGDVKELIKTLNERLSSAKKSLSEAKIEVAACRDSMNSKQSEVSNEIAILKENLLKKNNEIDRMNRELQNHEYNAVQTMAELDKEIKEKSSKIAAYESEIKQISTLSNELVAQLTEIIDADTANTENINELVKKGGSLNRQRRRSIKNVRRQ